MNEITAVVLTIGEDTTQRAVDSLNDQTVLPTEIVMIRNVTPFHKALNLGVSKVKTEFFIQVDSDMILDKNCLADLRDCIVGGVGVAVGHLRDPLVGRVVGIKMFRTECFEKVQFMNSISPDTDFVSDISWYDWKIVYALKYAGQSKRLWHTFGEHRPAYTPSYTFRKYLMEGRRYQYRKAAGGIRWHFYELGRSKHSASLIAQIAMAHGIFLQTKEDLLRPSKADEAFNVLHRFLETHGAYNVKDLERLLSLRSGPKEIFRKWYGLGIELHRSGSSSTFRQGMKILNDRNDMISWLAKVGLCHGIFSIEFDEEVFEREYGLLRELVSESRPEHRFGKRLAPKISDVLPRLWKILARLGRHRR